MLGWITYTVRCKGKMYKLLCLTNNLEIKLDNKTKRLQNIPLLLDLLDELDCQWYLKSDTNSVQYNHCSYSAVLNRLHRFSIQEMLIRT